MIFVFSVGHLCFLVWQRAPKPHKIVLRTFFRVISKGGSYPLLRHTNCGCCRGVASCILHKKTYYWTLGTQELPSKASMTYHGPSVDPGPCYFRDSARLCLPSLKNTFSKPSFYHETRLQRHKEPFLAFIETRMDPVRLFLEDTWWKKGPTKLSPWTKKIFFSSRSLDNTQT